MKKNDADTSGKPETKSQTLPSMSNKNQEPLKSIDAEDKIELERKEAYIEPKTRDLLRKLLQCCEKKEIIPIYTPGFGFIYHTADPEIKESDEDKISRDFLEDLSRLDILQRSFYDSVSACPNCESTIITLHNRCPKCRNHNVTKTSLTEHIKCGNIDQRSNFINNRCSKCGEPLIEGQYRNMGRWYVCNECGEKFETIEFDAVCRNCNRNFPLKEAQVSEIPKFKLNLNRMKEIRQNVASLEDIKMLLTDLGFNIEMPGLVVGKKSGMQHHFSLIAKKTVDQKEIVIVLDHSVSESEVQTSPLILYIYKTSEVDVDIPIFIAMPKLNDTARKIAEGHNILLIEGSTDQQEIIENIKLEIQKRINGKATVEKIKPEQDKGSFLSKFRVKKN